MYVENGCKIFIMVMNHCSECFCPWQWSVRKKKKKMLTVSGDRTGDILVCELSFVNILEGRG